MNDINLINKISDAIFKEKAEAYSKEQTFFEIIERIYDEDLISRYIAYVLRTDKSFCEKLIEYALEKTILINDEKVSVICEKTMSNCRADIFVETEKYTLTIENKVRSYEHDDQTQIYYDYVVSNYKQENGFLYLKPNWNQSSPVCKKFQEITYEQISQYFSSEDPKIYDFKKHIEKYFIKEHKMSDNLIAENYRRVKEFREGLNRIERDAKLYINDVVLNNMKRINIKIRDEVCNGTSYRIYLPEWKTAKYWFYVELWIVKGLDDIRIQGTVWHNVKDPDICLKAFLQSKTDVKKQWYILYDKTLENKYTILSEEWKTELNKFALYNSKLAFEKIEMLFREFLKQKCR